MNLALCRTRHPERTHSEQAIQVDDAGRELEHEIATTDRFSHQAIRHEGERNHDRRESKRPQREARAPLSGGPSWNRIVYLDHGLPRDSSQRRGRDEMVHQRDNADRYPQRRRRVEKLRQQRVDWPI